MTGNGECESLKTSNDLAISSQAPRELGEGSTTRLWSPERTVKTQECATTKKCKYCLEVKALSEFYPRYAQCKECAKERYRDKQREYYQANKETILARTNANYHANKETYLEYKRRERDSFPERSAETKARAVALAKETDLSAYNAKVAAGQSLKRARKQQATPKWANLEAIAEMYAKAAIIGYHVDHIIPLNGKIVCGLHVENNLQLLPPLDNLKKSNRLLVDDIVCTFAKAEEE